MERTGWWLTHHRLESTVETRLVSDHPVCARAEASQHFLDGAATPCILESTMVLSKIRIVAAPVGTVEKPSVFCECFSKSAVGIRVFCGFPSATSVSTGVPFLSSFLVLFSSFFDRPPALASSPPIFHYDRDIWVT
jgi:hypothetical protein